MKIDVRSDFLDVAHDLSEKLVKELEALQAKGDDLQVLKISITANRVLGTIEGIRNVLPYLVIEE